MGGGGEMMKENKLVLPPSKKEGYKNVVSGENKLILCAIYHCTHLSFFTAVDPRLTPGLGTLPNGVFPL